MKFAVFRCAENKEEIRINDFIKKLPVKIVDMYIENKSPYTYQSIGILGGEGYEIILPYTKDFANSNRVKAENMLKKIINDFYMREVNIVVLPDYISYQEGMRRSEGKAIVGLFVRDIIEVALKNQDIKNTKVLLIDGNNFLTDIVINEIYENINFLSVYTKNLLYWEEYAMSIQGETGLNINVVKSIKNIAFKEADIVINCSDDLENTDYFFKKGAVYIDVVGNREKIRRISEKRDDIILIDGLMLKTSEGVFSGEIIESALFVSDMEMKKFLTQEYKQSLQRSVKESMNYENIKINNFTLLGKDMWI